MINVFGEYTFDAKYYAKKLVALGSNTKFHKLELLPDYIDNRLAVKFWDGENLVPLSSQVGYYVIYEKLPLIQIETPVYAGYTKDSISKRVWRFGIEVCNIEPLIKTSGTHPGGRKYRKLGGTRDNLYIRFVLKKDIPFDIPESEIETLDEYIASLLKTTCNTKRKF